MLIKMLKTRRGSEDGFIVKQYRQGKSYEVRQALAAHFLNKGWAFNAEPEDNEAPLSAGQSVDAVQVLNELFESMFKRPILTNPASYLAVGKPL